jgi:hypothetical protein
VHTTSVTNICRSLIELCRIKFIHAIMHVYNDSTGNSEINNG